MCGENTIGKWATLGGCILLLGLIVTTLLVNIFGGGGDEEEIVNLGLDNASLTPQVFQEEQSGGINMFNLHLPTAVGSSVVFIIVLILLYFVYRRMLKRRTDRLAQNGRRGDERGDAREMSALYNAPQPPPYNPNNPMTMQNPVSPSWLEGWRSLAPTMTVAPMTQFPAIQPPAPAVPERSSSLQMEEIVRQHDIQREQQTNSAIRNALSSDERRANNMIQAALQGQ